MSNERARVLIVDPEAYADDPVIGALAEAARRAGGEPHLLPRGDLPADGSLHESLDPALVVIGPNVVQAPLLSRKLHRTFPSAQLVFVAHAADVSRLRQRLAYGAPASSRWTLLARDSDALLGSLSEAIEAARQARQLRTTLDRINLQLAASPSIDSRDLRRLVVSDYYLAAILAAAQDAIISLDRRGIVQTWNHGAERLFVIQASQAIGRRFLSLAPWSPDVAAVLEQAAGGSSVRHESAVELPGRTLHVELALSPVNDPSGRIFGIAAIVRDVSATWQLVHSLQQADRRKNEFLAMLGHELRNPLAPVRNGLRILERHGALPAANRPVLEMMDRQLRQMTRLVDDLLEISRISHGKIELKPERMLVESAVRAAVESVSPIVEQRRQRLSIAMPSEPLWISGDPARITQVLENLLSNAAKYTPEGGLIRLEVDAHPQVAEIRVIDDGIGIAADKVTEIFELFHQVDVSLDRSHGGLGIGLALVKRLVELHGGSVAASSGGLGKGATFVVRLPTEPSARQ